MATVKFVSPFHKITGTQIDNIDAADIRELCRAIISKYGEKMGFLLDENGDLSKKAVVLINRKNAFILEGSDTSLVPENEVIIMSYLGWA